MVLVAALVLASALVWSAVLVFAVPDMDSGAAALLAADLLVATVVAVAGLVISRSRWSRWLALGLVLVPLVLAPLLGAGGWVLWAGGLTSLAAAAALSGRRLGIGSRQRADAPPPAAVILALGLLLAPGWVALVSYNGLTVGLWALAFLAFLLAWSYGRAIRWSVSVLRLAFFPASLAAVIGSPLVAVAAVLTYSAGVAALAWTRPARLAVEGAAPVPGTVIALPSREVRAVIRNDR